MREILQLGTVTPIQGHMQKYNRKKYIKKNVFNTYHNFLFLTTLHGSIVTHPNWNENSYRIGITLAGSDILMVPWG